MSEQGKHINYTAADIEKYHKGLLTPAAMHAMEKAALGDPFLADAMEGYYISADHKTDLAELNNRLQQRIAATPAIPMYPEKTSRFNWWKVAAMLVLITGAGWLVYNLSFNNPPLTEKEIAATTAKDTNTAPVIPAGADAAPAPVTDSANTPISSNSVSMRKEKVNREKATTADAEKNSSPKDIAVSDPQKTNSTASITADEIKAEQEITVIAAPAMANQKKLNNSSIAGRTSGIEITPSLKKQAGSPAPVFYFKGRVTDPLNNPLSYVSILNPVTKTSLATDKNGYFSFVSSDSLLLVTASAVGYETMKLALQKAPDTNNIILQNNNNVLAEVVIVGYGQRQKKSIVGATTEIAPQPIGGWENFKEYISKNRRSFHVDENSPLVSGVVELIFDIGNSSRPENIIISKSLCDACDKEAVRLLAEGPGWIKSTNGRKAAVTIRF